MVSILISTPNHTPLKYMHPSKVTTQIRLAYHTTISSNGPWTLESCADDNHAHWVDEQTSLGNGNKTLTFLFLFFLCVVMAMILRWLLGSHTKQGCCWVLVNVGLSPPMDILPIKLIIKLEFPISKRTVNNDFWATFDVLRNQHEYCTSHDWEFPPQTHMPSCRNERKITPISKDQHEVEPFGLMLITVFHDAV